MGEVEYVDECPVCGVEFVGMSPEEYRNEHAPECNPLAVLYYFSGGSA